MCRGWGTPPAGGWGTHGDSTSGLYQQGGKLALLCPSMLTGGQGVWFQRGREGSILIRWPSSRDQGEVPGKLRRIWENNVPRGEQRMRGLHMRDVRPTWISISTGGSEEIPDNGSHHGYCYGYYYYCFYYCVITSLI